MTDMDRFEQRLAVSLQRLADEVPTSVEAHELAGAIAEREARRGWRSLPLGLWRLGRLPAHQVALALLLVPALALGVLALNQPHQTQGPVAPQSGTLYGPSAGGLISPPPAGQPTGRPLGGELHGLVVCAGSPWTTEPATGPLVLECTSKLPAELAAGAVRITLAPPVPVPGAVVRAGSIELRAAGASRAGDLSLWVAPSGMVVGDASLTSSGSADGGVLDLHLTSTDGLTWGVQGAVREPG